MTEIFAAFTGKSLGQVESLDENTIAEFLQLPSKWYVQLCDGDKVIRIDPDLARALHMADRHGRILQGFGSDKRIVSLADVVLAAMRENSNALEYASEYPRADQDIILATASQ
jgi:hypothetical protein